MKVIYTNTLPSKPVAGVCYRTAFMGVISGATSIEIDEDFPDADLVDQAYAFLDTQSVLVDIGDLSATQVPLSSMKLEIEELQTANTNLTTDLQNALDAKDQVQAKLTETEGQLSTVQAEHTELKAKIAEMEKASTAKKPTAAELKAAAKAEDAKAAEQTQE